VGQVPDLPSAQMHLRPLNTWLPQAIGLLTAAITAILATTPHSLTWPRLLAASAFIVFLASLSCAVAMFLTCAALPPIPGVGQMIRRTSATAALLAPVVILLQQNSLWAPATAAFLVWTILPTQADPKPQWKKFAGSLCAATLLQIGIAAALGDESLISALALGSAAAPILWRIRQERNLRGPFQPRATAAIALLLAILGLTHYLPVHYGSEGTNAKGPSSGKQSNTAQPGLAVGGKYRGVILFPEEEEHVILVPPLPMMGRDPFRAHKDPLGIPFYGVYWFFQSPDKAPNQDAYRVKGAPDNVSFHSADLTPLKMEAHQNLGRLIDVKACSRIDIVIRNADIFVGSWVLELLLVNTTEPDHPFQWLDRAPVTSKPGSQETLSFKIPSATAIQQFDELAIRFTRANYRETRSARIAIDRFYLVPRK
jgi:hypothetical protein